MASPAQTLMAAGASDPSNTELFDRYLQLFFGANTPANESDLPQISFHLQEPPVRLNYPLPPDAYQVAKLNFIQLSKLVFDPFEVCTSKYTRMYQYS